MGWFESLIDSMEDRERKRKEEAEADQEQKLLEERDRIEKQLTVASKKKRDDGSYRALLKILKESREESGEK